MLSEFISRCAGCLIYDQELSSRRILLAAMVLLHMGPLDNKPFRERALTSECEVVTC